MDDEDEEEEVMVVLLQRNWLPRLECPRGAA